MRIMINDHAGHPFQVQLSRSLATRGHSVLHTYCARLNTPRGKLTPHGTDPDTLEIAGVYPKKEFARYSPLARFWQERELGRLICAEIDRFKPEVVVAANTPLGAVAAIQRECRRHRIKFVYWVQDLLGVGIRNNIRKKLPVLGAIVGWRYERLEQALLRRSDQAVVITEDFCPIMAEAGVRDDRVHVIHNWAPLDEVPPLTKSNEWSMQQGLDRKTCLLYAGTLGMKHNPHLLVELARAFRDREDVKIVVITEGIGGDFLRKAKEQDSLNNLVLMPFQSFDTLPMVLATADILIAILEPDAGVFAVPSKVLTYLCTRRPLLMAVPPENLAARIVKDNHAGIVVDPSELDSFVLEAMRLLDDERLRDRLAENGLAYAQKTFDIDRTTDRFLQILTAA